MATTVGIERYHTDRTGELTTLDHRVNGPSGRAQQIRGLVDREQHGEPDSLRSTRAVQELARRCDALDVGQCGSQNQPPARRPDQTGR